MLLTRRNETARCPRTLPGLRTCYRTRRAQKTRRVLVRGSGSTMNRHTHTQPQKRAARDKRGPRAPHTHCRHTTSATRRPAREERTAHTQFKFECDRAPSECAGPGSRRGRRHGLQHDGDGAASRRRYGGGRVYMELTIDGWASRPAGGLVWSNGVPVWRRQHQCKSLDRPISFPRGAVTGCENVLSPMSRRREVRWSLRADRPRG